MYHLVKHIHQKKEVSLSSCIDYLVNSLDYRANGKQFLTAPPKKGHDTKDSYFDKHFIRLFEVIDI
jgi:hypothetical protein